MIYILLVHESPEVMERTLKKLSDRENHFVIHVDKGSDLLKFERFSMGISNCHFIQERYETLWGSFQLVEATLAALRYIEIELDVKQRIILLSGTHYVIKDNDYISSYFDKYQNSIFLEYEKIPNKGWVNGGTTRFPLYDEIRNQIQLYGGSQWFSMPYKALYIIFEFIEDNPDFLAYFRYVTVPDESFFQTLFLNCENNDILTNVINCNLSFIKWQASPKVLTNEDYHELKNTDKLFARKFLYPYSMDLIDRLK